MTKTEIAAQKAADEKLAAEKLAAEQKAAEDAKPKEKVYTSEKLTELEAKRKAAKAEGRAAGDAGNEKLEDEKLTEAWKIGEEIKKEIQALKVHELEVAKKEKEAATIQLLTTAYEAYHANQNAIGNDALTLDEKNALNDAFKAAHEVVANRLLGSVPKVKVAGTESKGTKGAAGQAVIDAMDAGKTYDEMIAEGHKDGTIRSIAWSEKYGKNPDGTYTKK